MRAPWILSIFVLSTALASSNPLRAEEPPGSLAGTVLEVGQQGPSPIAGAKVEAIGEGIPGRPSTFTGADGHFLLSDLPPGNYRLVAFKPATPPPGFLPTYYRQQLSTFDFRQAAVLPLAAGQNLAGLDIALISRESFSGSILGAVTRAEDGQPVGGALVKARAGYSIFEAIAISAANGDYLIPNLPPGNYSVQASAPDYAREFYPDGHSPQEGLVVSVPGPPPGGPIPDIDLSLDPGGSILGKVVLQGNPSTPVASAHVAALDAQGHIVSLADSDPASGHYKIDFLPLGSYRVISWIPPWRPENLALEFYQDASSFLTATPLDLTLASPQATAIDLSLPGGSQIQGSIVDEHGTPLEKALITAHPENNPAGQPFSALSAADGSYSIDKLPAGRYSVEATAPGKIHKFHDNVLTRLRATPIELAQGQLITGIDFQLPPGRTLHGAVTLATQPVPAAKLTLVEPLFGLSRTILTDPSGNYSMDGLVPLDSYLLVVNAKDAAPRLIAPVNLKPADLQLDVTLEAGYSLDGRILSLQGSALPNASVELSHPKIPQVLATHSDDQGRYHFEHLPSLRGYRIDAWAPGYARGFLADLSLESGDLHDINLSLGPGRSLGGTITLQGAAAEGIRVTAHSSTTQSHGSARTNADGSYTIEGLEPAADFVLVAGRDSLHIVPRPGLIDLTGGNATGIDLDIPAGRSISGQVISGGAPVVGAKVSAWSPTVLRGGIARTDLEGKFTIENLPSAADYRLLALASGFAPQFYPAAASPQDSQPIDLSGGSATGRDFNLVPGWSISGRVLDSTGSGAPAAFLSVVNGSGKLVGTGRSLPTGYYETSLVASGTYRIVARSPQEAEPAQVTGITVTGQSVNGVELQFQPRGALEGTVQLAGGGDPSAATVLIFRKGDQGFAQIAPVSADGQYRAAPLLPGEYYATAQAEGFASRAYPDATSLATASSILIQAGSTATGIDLSLPVQAKRAKRPTVTGAGLAIGFFSAPPGAWSANSRLSLGWQPVDQAVAYSVSIDQSAQGGASTEVDLQDETTSFTSEALEDGVYYAHVRSFSVERDPDTGLPTQVISDEEDAGPFLIDSTAPPPPDQLTATKDSSQISLGWRNPLSEPGGSGLDKIQIHRDPSEFPGGNTEGQLVFLNDAPQLGGQEQYADASINEQATYYYSVFAIDAAGNVSIPGAQIQENASAFGEDGEAPSSPEQLSAEVADNQITLGWKNPSNGDLQGVEVRHSTQSFTRSDQGEVLARLSGRSNALMSYIHQNPGPGSHYYSVYAYDAAPNYSELPARVFAYVSASVPAIEPWAALVFVAAWINTARRRIRWRVR